jgi:hypothetical protein
LLFEQPGVNVSTQVAGIDTSQSHLSFSRFGNFGEGNQPFGICLIVIHFGYLDGFELRR